MRADAISAHASERSHTMLHTYRRHCERPKWMQEVAEQLDFLAVEQQVAAIDLQSPPADVMFVERLVLWFTEQHRGI